MYICKYATCQTGLSAVFTVLCKNKLIEHDAEQINMTAHGRGSI